MNDIVSLMVKMTEQARDIVKLDKDFLGVFSGSDADVEEWAKHMEIAINKLLATHAELFKEIRTDDGGEWLMDEYNHKRFRSFIDDEYDPARTIMLKFSEAFGLKAVIL